MVWNTSQKNLTNLCQVLASRPPRHNPLGVCHFLESHSTRNLLSRLSNGLGESWETIVSYPFVANPGWLTSQSSSLRAWHHRPSYSPQMKAPVRRHASQIHFHAYRDCSPLARNCWYTIECAACRKLENSEYDGVLGSLWCSRGCRAGSCSRQGYFRCMDIAALHTLGPIYTE